MLGIDMWVKLHGHARWTPPPGQEFNSNATKYILAVHFILYPPKNIFFKMINVSWIASHLKFTFSDHFYINVRL